MVSSRVSDDCKIMLGRLELEMATNYEQLPNLRITLFYVSKLISVIKYGVPESSDGREKDLSVLIKLHDRMRTMQKEISVGTGERREHWKSVLAELSDIQMKAGGIATKYDLIRYEIGEYADFNK